MRMLFLALSLLIASPSHASVLTSHEQFESLYSISTADSSKTWLRLNEQNIATNLNLPNTNKADRSFSQGIWKTKLNDSLSHIGSSSSLLRTETYVLVVLGVSVLLVRRRKLQF
ncbi:hypothetical protein ACFQNF_13005 [Iodobacter arcticus]|uniref:PEP-CTERM protein-sorting domain-containing protein n=1 Tax=Iodobacter arcticus TaxID=590593 RepID=A0ABW2QZ90_9NEIS